MTRGSSHTERVWKKWNSSHFTWTAD